MKLRKILPAMAVLSGFAMQAQAAVTAEEAKQLGTTLTLFGAEKAGNADGTIPEYTGGLTTPPAGYKPGTSNTYTVFPDPFAGEKPLFRIDAKNMDKYADKLSAGAKQLMKLNADYYLNIYPTHRTIALPDDMLKATVRNATQCKTLNKGIALDAACRGGMPFPIPKNGYEVMWNKIIPYRLPTFATARSWMVDAAGHAVMTAEYDSYTEVSHYMKDRPDLNKYTDLYAITLSPSRKAGEASGFSDFYDPINNPRKAWAYAPGQRRIKLAPEFGYDTPVSTTGGVMLFDEIFLFNGAMDRFDFKLVGKKEMYIPYNNYKAMFGCTGEQMLQAKHINAECERWELHRVWEVEAVLKPGMRHVYSKRRFYWDEDNFQAGLSDAWDQAGQLYRGALQYNVQIYADKFQYAPTFTIYDFNKGNYTLVSHIADPRNGVKVVPPLSNKALNPESISGQGIR